MFEEKIISKFSKDSFQQFFVSGIDEVGRGPLAGPVVATGAFYKFEDLKKLKLLNKLLRNLGVNDSKKLSSIKRQIILQEIGIDCEKIWHNWDQKNKLKIKRKISAFDLEIILSYKNSIYIDQHNILQSALACMSDCLKSYKNSRVLGFIDGNKIPKINCKKWELHSIVKGDAKLPLIGLASIVAKEFRDYWMSQIGQEYPEYGFERHAGYGTKFHLEAIKNKGPSPYHRATFKGVKEYLQ